MSQYADALSDGHKAMFARYDSFRMPIFPSRRSVKFPNEVYKATRNNALTGRLEGTDALTDAALGFPFPIPQRGEEIIFNHKTRYRGESIRRSNNQAVVLPNGSFSMTKMIEEAMFRYGSISKPYDQAENMLLYYRQFVAEPPRLAGERVLVHEPLDQAAEVRKVWVYNPGQRRIRRAPDAGYDSPGRGSDGLRTNDQTDMYNGAMHRYQWTLIGKRELYVPYNAYRINRQGLSYEEILGAHHLNPEFTRFERHRVWVVDAELAPGTKHVYGKRRFYVDEDSWSILHVDLYDERGQLWRVQTAHGLYHWGLQIHASIPECSYDLLATRYICNNLITEGKAYSTADLSDGDFKTSRLTRWSGN